MTSIAFRPLRRADFPLLGAWLAQPHVARWWNHQTSPRALEADFGAGIDGTDRAELFIALVDAQPAGFVQRYRFADNPGYMADVAAIVAAPGAALSIDFFIGDPALLRRGLGAAMIRAAVQAIWRDYPPAPSILVPVNAANQASWRTLARAGLTRAGAGPLEPDNPVDGRLHYVYRIDRPAAGA